MRVLKYENTVNAPVEQVFDWLVKLDKNYIKWHPDTHVCFEWLSPLPVRTGSLFRFEEKVEGRCRKMVMRISCFKKNEQLSFSSLSINANSKYLPGRIMDLFISLFQVEMEMDRLFESTAKGSTTIHTTHKLGSNLAFWGVMVDWVAEHFFLSSKSHLEHIKEESFNMKTDLEKNRPGSD